MTLQEHARRGGDPVTNPTSSSEGTAVTPMPDGQREPALAPWHQTFRRLVLVTDAAVLCVAVTLAEIIRFGMDANIPGSQTITYTVLGLVVAIAWWLALQLDGATDPLILGHGPAEYRRVTHASVMAFGVVAIVTLLLKQDLSRGYLAIAFPIGLLGLLLSRKGLRIWLVKRRENGSMTTNVLIIGGATSADSIAHYFHRYPGAGYRVSGVWVPDSQEVNTAGVGSADHAVPILGNTCDLVDAIQTTQAGAVIVTDTEHLGQRGLKELTWELDSFDVELLVSPNVVDVSGARMALTTVGKLPLLSVRKPTYGEAAAWPKRAFDIVGSACIITLASPLLIVVAALVKATSRGPILYRQERIGRDGRPFGMLKFRSMTTDADDRLALLLAEQGRQLGPLAKLDDDPRITRVGVVIRRYSIDELPQLFNVLIGNMSLVGPRPQRQFEVDRYDIVAKRRLRVLPGMTGLWQVSGRSDLSWEDTVRLDNYYVENWSLLADMSILWRTVRAVVRSDGAR